MRQDRLARGSCPGYLNRRPPQVEVHTQRHMHRATRSAPRSMATCLCRRHSLFDASYSQVNSRSPPQSQSPPVLQMPLPRASSLVLDQAARLIAMRGTPDTRSSSGSSRLREGKGDLPLLGPDAPRLPRWDIGVDYSKVELPVCDLG